MLYYSLFYPPIRLRKDFCCDSRFLNRDRSIFEDATLVTCDKPVVSKFVVFTGSCKLRIQSSTLKKDIVQFPVFGFIVEY